MFMPPTSVHFLNGSWKKREEFMQLELSGPKYPDPSIAWLFWPLRNAGSFTLPLVRVQWSLGAKKSKHRHIPWLSYITFEKFRLQRNSGAKQKMRDLCPLQLLKNASRPLLIINDNDTPGGQLLEMPLTVCRNCQNDKKSKPSPFRKPAANGLFHMSPWKT